MNRTRGKAATETTEQLLARAERRLAEIAAGRKDDRLSKDGGPIRAKSTDAGVVYGYASTWDREPDAYGDVVARGAFTRTLAEWGRKQARGIYIPLLYGHRTDDPKYNIGRITEAVEDGRGLHVKAEFDGNNETAQYVRKLAKEGRIFQFSFAYAVRDQATVTLAGGARANELRDLDLYEVSLVQIPANQHATVTDIKGGRANAATDLAKARREARRVLAAAELQRARIEAEAALEEAELTAAMGEARRVLDGLDD